MLYQSLRGIPLSFEFEWPVHASHSGSDWSVVHGRATLADGSGLHADFAVNMSRSVVGALPSLDPKDVRPIAINAVRKAVDTRDIEFLKSGKRQPIQCSSRVFSVVDNKWTFTRASDDELSAFLERKVYWDCVREANPRSWIGDPIEALYFDSKPSRLVSLARSLADKGVISLDGDLAAPTAKLRERADEFDELLQAALHDLEAKHSYERA